MFRNCMLPVCVPAILAIVLSAPTIALSQSQYSGYTGTGGLSLNQVALRNAQQLMMSSLQPPSSMTSAGRIGLGLGESYSGNKPFTGYSNGPAVSPYLNLFRVDLGGGNNNYSTLVEPQLRQQQLNQQQQRQNQQTSRRLQAISAQGAFSSQGSREEAPTGHQTVFQYTGNYYPPYRAHTKKQR